MAGPRVLIAEDDLELRELLVRGLRAADFEARSVGSGRDLLAGVASWSPDALIVDIGLPDADGRDVCQALRAHGENLPIIFLTARDARSDRLAGFSAGGDDYMTKPFDFEEVVARLHALLRRAGRRVLATETAGLRLDPAAHAASDGSRSVKLTPTEFRLLAALAATPGAAVRRAALRAAAWPDGAVVHDNTIDVYIARLRRKLAELEGPPRIANVYAVGFSLEGFPSPPAPRRADPAGRRSDPRR